MNSLIKIMLEILDKEEQTVEIGETHTCQIKEYLALLDLIIEMDLLHFPSTGKREKITVISQPGIRYTQSDALASSLLPDEKFSKLPVGERQRIRHGYL